MSAMFVRHGEGLSRMIETPYEAESILQRLLTEYPGLLSAETEAGEQSWLLIQQELGVASETDGGARWSLDHLFVDRSGIPTLVEVKRSSDTRIRREVVGQMLDYAANGSSVWSEESIRSSFETAVKADGGDPARALEDFLGDDIAPARFWEQVGLNLRAGRIRLVFVADAIPPELRRIIEFLNEQMAETEVIGVEVKQFQQAEGTLETFVSNVIGQTQVARRTKSSSTRSTGSWDLDSFEQGLTNTHSERMVRRIMTLHQKLIDAGAVLKMGTGATEPSANYRLGADGDRPVSLSIYMNGIAINFDFVRRVRSEPEMRRWLELAGEIPGAEPHLSEVEARDWRIRPTLPFEAILENDEAADVIAAKMIEAAI